MSDVNLSDGWLVVAICKAIWSLRGDASAKATCDSMRRNNAIAHANQHERLECQTPNKPDAALRLKV